MTVRVTDHAQQTWFSRSDAQHIGVERAWHEAEAFPACDVDGDEARYHERAGVVLVRKDREVVTCLPERLKYPHAALEVAELGDLELDLLEPREYREDVEARRGGGRGD